MAFSHLEQLISEFLEWQGYLIKRNVKVGRLKHGGWSMELDVIGYHPGENRLVHFEPSIDALPWATRESRYKKKFEAGRKHIKEEIFKWVDGEIELEQFAVFISHPQDRNEIAGGKIISLDELALEIKEKITEKGVMAKNAISESFPLLRTIQLITCGYQRIVKPTESRNKNMEKLREVSEGRQLRWNLNIKHAWYATQVPLTTKTASVAFGIKDIDGSKRQLGVIELDFEDLYKRKRITKTDTVFRVSIFLEGKKFYIAQSKDNKNRTSLELPYP